MSNLPWWALSPSPFSITFYLILIGYAFRRIKQDKWLIRFADAFFLVGFIVLTTDTLWILSCGLRFGIFYPDSVKQLIFSAARNITGIILCYLLVGSYFKKRIIRLENAWFGFTLNMIFLIVWFALSPTPAYTDWTYAIRHNYPTTIILISFFTSHLLGKSLVAFIFFRIWN